MEYLTHWYQSMKKSLFIITKTKESKYTTSDMLKEVTTNGTIPCCERDIT